MGMKGTWGEHFSSGMGDLLLSVCSLLPCVPVSGLLGQLGSCSWDTQSRLVLSPAAPLPRAWCGLALGCRTAALCSPMLPAPAFAPFLTHLGGGGGNAPVHSNKGHLHRAEADVSQAQEGQVAWQSCQVNPRSYWRCST